MQIVHKTKDEITAVELRQISRLHFDDGIIWKKFNEPSITNKVVYLIKEGMKVVGWALVYQLNTAHVFPYAFFHVFVKESYRRKGIGTNLWNEAKKFYGNKLWGTNHDNLSESFYRKMGQPY